MAVAAGDPVEAADVNVNAGFGQLTADSTTYGSTESASLLNVVTNVVSGQQYWITLSSNVSVDVASDSSVLRIREDTAAGTQLMAPQVGCISTSTVGYSITAVCKYTAAATGPKTFVLTGQRNGGTGTAHRIRAGGSRPTFVTVDRIQ